MDKWKKWKEQDEERRRFWHDIEIYPLPQRCPNCPTCLAEKGTPLDDKQLQAELETYPEDIVQNKP